MKVRNIFLVRKFIHVATATLVLMAMGQVAFAQSSGNALVARESVGRLFFTEQQRGVLEATRQGIADFDPAEISSPTFAAPLEAPKLVLRSAIKTVVSEGNTVEAVYERDQDFSFDGVISKSGDTRILVGSQVIDASELQALERNLGLNIVANGADDVTAEDKLFQQKLTFTRGDVLRSDGTLEKPGTEGRFVIVKRQ